MKSLRLPFVVTVGVSTAAACGGTVVVHRDGSGGSTSTSNVSTSNGSASTSSQVPTDATEVTTGSVSCPPNLVDGYTPCDLPDGAICNYQVSCQSGAVDLSFSCQGGYWSILPQACEFPYDSCPGTELWCDGQWWMPTATNPPAPCPSTLPAEGTPCFVGGMGGDHEHCGYACGPDPQVDGWVVATCVQPDPSQEGTWQQDGGCL